MEICQSSEKSKSVTKTAGKIPFELMKKDESVYVSSEVNIGSLRSVVSHACRKYGKEFKVVPQLEHRMYEIACVDTIRPLTESVGMRIVESSDKAKAKFATEFGSNKKYPFDELTEGKSFPVAAADANEASLRVQCSTWGKRLSKKFIVVPHEGVFEVACIPVKKIDFFDNSPEAIAKAGVLPNVFPEPAPVVSPAEAFTAAPRFFTESATEGNYED